MVSSYLICDVCGRFGPPASTLSEDGLRLCYSCWFAAHPFDEPPPDAESRLPEAAPGRGAAVEKPDSKSSEGNRSLPSPACGRGAGGEGRRFNG